MRWENNRDERMRQRSGGRGRREQQWKHCLEVEKGKREEAGREREQKGMIK